MGHWLPSYLSFGIVPLIVDRILVLYLVMLLREHYEQWSALADRTPLDKEEEEEKIEGQVFQSHIVVKKKRYGLRSFGSRA